MISSDKACRNEPHRSARDHVHVLLTAALALIWKKSRTVMQPSA
jgi:hypothetical protein